MIHINLLPVRQIKQKAAASQQLVTVFFSFLLILVIMVVVGFFQASNASLLNNDIAQLNKEKQRHDNTLKKINKLKKNKDVIEKKIAIIKKLKKSSSLTVHALDEVANVTPADRIWLKSLSQSGSSLQLTGMALDNRTIAKYMEDLKISPYITSVNLANSSQQTYAGRNLKAFSISCTISIPVEKKTENPQKNNRLK